MYNFKIANIDDIQDILNLKNDLYNNNNDFNRIRLKLITDYDEQAFLGTLVYDKNKLVCTYLTYSQTVSISGKLYKILQAGDSMTDIKYLGQNLIIDAGKETYKRAISLNYEGIFGFPLKNIERTRLKCLDWKRVNHMNSYNIYVPTIPFAFILLNLNLDKIYFIYLNLIIKLFYKKGNNFQSSNSDEMKNDYIHRSDSFWNYKMNYFNKYLLKIDNVNIVIKFDKFLYIGDIETRAIKNSFIFRFKLFLFAFLTFNTILKTYCSPESPLDNFLKNISNSKKSLSFCYKNFNNKISLQYLKFTYFDYDTF
jgi:hypothetical protein